MSLMKFEKYKKKLKKKDLESLIDIIKQENSESIQRIYQRVISVNL